MTPEKPAVTPRQYALLRGLSPSTVGRQIRDGKIPRRPDGLLDVAAADAGRRNNLDSTKVDQAKEQKRQRQRRQTKPCPAVPPASVVEVRGEHQARRAALFEIVSAEEVAHFARVVLRFPGATPELAYLCALWFSQQPCFTLADIPEEELIQLREFRNEEWTAVLGRAINHEALDEIYDRAIAPELKPNTGSE